MSGAAAPDRSSRKYHVLTFVVNDRMSLIIGPQSGPEDPGPVPPLTSISVGHDALTTS